MISFLAFSFKRALEGFWRNKVMSLAATVTMILMLILISGLVIVLTGLEAGLRFVEEKVEVQAFLNDGVSAEAVNGLVADIEALPEVASVSYTSKEAGLNAFREQLAAQGKEDLTAVTGVNPIPASLNVKLKDPGVYGDVVKTLEAPRGVVDEVLETQRTADAIVNLSGVLRTIGLVIVVMVGLTVLFIVINTIRMAVMARADEIEIMRLVGASDAFIRWPFIIEGLFVGLLGGAITLGLLSLAGDPIRQVTAQITGELPIGFNEQLTQQLLAAVLGLGVVVGGIGAWISVRTYLIR